MNKKQNGKSITKENGKKKNNETADFLQLLQSNGMFVDCVSPMEEAMEDIEKQLK